jgi:ATP/maltotriose-dependent transcriptional regulator MalT
MATGTLSNRGFPHFGLVWLWDPETAACPDTGGAEDCGVRIAERGTTSATAADPSHTLDRLAESRPRITLAASRVRPPGSWLRVVERRRLLDRVSRAVADAPFTLISAPAGYGKTVLASEWAGSRASHLRPAAWLTVSERDNDPGVFWCHVFFALAFVGAIAADAPLPMVCAAPAVDELGALLLGAGGRAVLVLDAADRLRNPTIFDQLGRLLEGAGERLRLVTTTRADPPMPLHRYRREGMLAEIRHDEIAFNRDEVEGLLNLHGLVLPDESVKDVWSAPRAGLRAFGWLRWLCNPVETTLGSTG